MKILVTGATGFVGRHVVSALLEHGHEVTATAIDPDCNSSMPWRKNVSYMSCDLHDPTLDLSVIFDIPDVLVHLAWPGLPNYKDLFHFEENLPAAYRFLKSMIEMGTKQVLVTGTCFEYGMQSGPLSEEMPTAPSNPYGLAKDSLRKFLEALQMVQPYVLQWVRLFYMYGPGQNANSLMAQLNKAIDNAEAVFPMSGGDQLRDYLSVQEVARRISHLVGHTQYRGIINCCSGNPVSVRSLVETRIRESGAKLHLELGHYPYPDYEPMAFWGTSKKLSALMSLT